jgi:hypothetical protein
VLFSAFVKELGARLTTWESDLCRELCDKRDVQQLVQHFVRTELHVQQGSLRRELLSSPDNELVGKSLKKLLVEREELTAHVCVWIPEDSLVTLFLDHELIWPTVKALLVSTSEYKAAVGDKTSRLP